MFKAQNLTNDPFKVLPYPITKCPQCPHFKAACNKFVYLENSYPQPKILLDISLLKISQFNLKSNKVGNEVFLRIRNAFSYTLSDEQN